jgi:CcmD family protein
MTPDTFPALFWSYTAVWVILGVFILSLGVRLRKVEKKLGENSKGCCGKDA